MSRYAPPDFRGPRDRSRSPPRFPERGDRRPSAASIFDPRPPGPARYASDAPRGPRSQFDGPPTRPPPGSNLGPGPLRPGYSSLRDAPPLGTAERGRPFREREYERRDRIPSPRERSPPRPLKDPRDFVPRELDIPRARRGSRDGPPSAGSNYSDHPPFPAAPPSRGGFSGRGRGRGDFGFRGGRGGRRDFEERERETFRRERSPPPPRWIRDPPREDRELERRDERRFDRRDEERRPEWLDREREIDRVRRDQPPARLEARRSNESITSGPPAHQPPQTLPIDPGRLALLEQAGADISVRRPSVPQNVQPPQREPRRDMPETSSYLNGRAENTANRYKAESSPPTQAPPVPAFTLSFAPAASQAPPTHTAQAPKPMYEDKSPFAQERDRTEHSEPPAQAPEVARVPTARKPETNDPPPTAPKAPRALEAEGLQGFGARLQGVRSLENVQGPRSTLGVPGPSSRPSPSGPTPVSPAASVPTLPTLVQPFSPRTQPPSRPVELNPPTGPRASRMSPALASVSPRPPFASPRSDVSAFQGWPGLSRGQTPPPSAPSGPRNRSFSVSPKVTTSAIPTAPKGSRGPPLAPRGGAERGPPPGRAPDRLGAPPPWAPPTGPRGVQWNQWRRQGPLAANDRVVPAKRDFSGEEKDRRPDTMVSRLDNRQEAGVSRADFIKAEEHSREPSGVRNDNIRGQRKDEDMMDLGHAPVKPASATDHSTAQSFFGKPAEPADEDVGMSDAVDPQTSDSDEDDDDTEQGLALLNAKFERKKRELEAQFIDLSKRDYRATTPLESIARLSRMSEKDLQRAQEHQEMEVDEPPAMSENHLMPPATHSSGTDEGPDLLTPKGEEDPAVEVRSSEDDSENIRRVRRPSPEVISLPYLIKEPRNFQDNDAFQQTVERQEESKAAVLAALEDGFAERDELELDAEDDWSEELEKWRQEAEDMDREREQLERIERQRSAEPVVEMAPPVAPPANPVPEGRRLHKYSSEYDVEQVIKQSEETARLEQEKQDRESRKLQADLEKEAKLPTQETEERLKRGVFIDANRLRDPDALTRVFAYEPQPDTFSEHEQQIFIAAFKETPKKWGEIASLLPGRTYRDCIHHYYANKWDGRFRDRQKKMRAGRGRGRGGRAPVRGRGAAAMADLGSAEELMPIQNVSESGRPRRAAAPKTFGDKEEESKAALTGPSPAKKMGPAARQDGNGEAGPEKPGKRRKGMGDKPGRKSKAAQPLAALAAAPSASPGKLFAMQSMQTKEDIARAQTLEDANLLASLQSGHPAAMPAGVPGIYPHEGFPPSAMPLDDPSRGKGPGPAGSKTGPSSYWSVPEQQDFVKYIAHFGTDWVAIANHMGTKTQVMIKNHYARQISGGSQPELKMAAEEADRRRDNGEEFGPPPTPTPIVKRKYDQPQATVPRALAPHGDPMEIDEPAIPQRVPSGKHVSPPQYQAQPRFTTSAQATPIPAHRVVPSPVPSTASPAVSQAHPSAAAKPMQHPLGARLSFLPEGRSESRPGLPQTSAFRLSQEGTPRSQPQQPSQVPDAQYIRGLMQEQERAMQMQEHQRQQERMEMQRQSIIHRGSVHGSPSSQPLHNPPVERKPLFEERASTPPRGSLGQSPFARPAIGSAFPPFASTPLSSSLLGRPSFNPSPPKKEETRPSSVPVPPPQAPVPAVAPPPPEPPKRSNVMSLLNSEPEEPKPPKRESLPSMSQRAASPAPSSVSNTPGLPPPGPPSRRETTFGQPSLLQSSFQRPPFGQSGQQTPGTPSIVKQEPAPREAPGFGPKQDWAARVLGQPPQTGQPSRPSPPPTLEREVRPYFPHRSALGGLNQPSRANPSPPPHPLMGHSRTPSLSSQSLAGQQRQELGGQQGQHGVPPSVQPLHPNPYAQAPTRAPFSQPPPQAHNHAHHSHNSSLTGGFPPMHQRAPSREDMRHEQMRHEQQNFAAQREREEMEWRRRDEMERQRELQYHMQREHEDRERQQQQSHAFSRGPPPPQALHPSFPGPPPPMGQGRFGVGLRDQSLREVEAAMQREQDRQMQQEVDRRHREAAMFRERDPAEERRRQEEALYRRTPLGGGFGFGHPPPPRRQ